MNPLAPLKPRRRQGAGVEKLYGAIVAQARLPVFYQAFGVPDTLEGRYSVLTLHLFAVLHRLTEGGAEPRDLSQKLTDTFTADMETVLREIGAGDLSIPKKVRGLAAKSAALLQGYEEAFGNGPEAFTAVVAESLPLEGAAARSVATRLASYVKEAIDCLEVQAVEAFVSGQIKFTDVSVSSEKILGNRFDA